MPNIFKQANLNIINESTYNSLELYDKIKSNKGFYTDILKKLEELLAFSLVSFLTPKVSHFTIDEPNLAKLPELRKDLARFMASRDKVKGAKNSKFLYLATLETRPRNKQEHLHLIFFFDRLTVRDLNLLEERLAKFSNSNKAKLHHRRLDCLPYLYDPETGVMRFTKRGDPARKGSTAWHDLRTEYHDAFKRLSYLAKVYSKSKDYYLSSSRLTARQLIDGTGNPAQSLAASFLKKSITARVEENKQIIEFADRCAVRDDTFMQHYYSSVERLLLCDDCKLHW